MPFNLFETFPDCIEHDKANLETEFPHYRSLVVLNVLAAVFSG